MPIGYVYMIKSTSTDKIYIGSTIDFLNTRFSKHKTNKIPCACREIITYGDAQIELLEEIQFENKEELLWKEREYQEQFGNLCVNERRAIITEEERKEEAKENYQKNKERIKEYHKANKERINELRRERRRAKLLPTQES